MTTVTKQSPMNLKHLNDADTGIDALSRAELTTCLLDLLPGRELLGGLRPGL